MFKIEFETTNSAFDDPADEIAAILALIASRLTGGETEGLIKDSNGNRIGSWKLEN